VHNNQQSTLVDCNDIQCN